MLRRKSLAGLASESEKQTLFDITPTVELLRSSSYATRRRSILALCGIGVLITGAALITLSLFCHDISAGDFRLSSVYVRDLSTNLLVDAGATTVNVGVTVTRPPNKFFGPTILPQAAALFKASNNLGSVEKRDLVLSDTLKMREAIEKRALEMRGTVWQPAPSTNWTYQLSETPSSDQLKNAGQYQVWDIDLFDTPVSTIQTIQAAGSKVICYFSAGTVEGWRSDANKFQSADIGQPMGSWPNENWLNTRSTSVRKIMAARLDLAKSKGCNGVDPDNMDAYSANTGFNLQQSDAVNYVTFLANQASQRGLAISLKNAGDIISRVLSVVQYSVEEACNAYSECDLYKPFTDAGKAVFHVEYPKGYGTVNTATVASSSMAAICTCKSTLKLSPIVKNNNLDSWQQQCP